MADVNAALAFKIYPTHTCFNGSRLGPLDAKRMWKQRWPSKLFANIYVFLMVDVKHRWPLKFSQHLWVLMANVKALLAFKVFANTYVF